MIILKHITLSQVRDSITHRSEIHGKMIQKGGDEQWVVVAFQSLHERDGVHVATAKYQFCFNRPGVDGSPWYQHDELTFNINDATKTATSM